MSTFRLSFVLLKMLLRLNNACEEQDFHLLYQVFHPWLRLVLVPQTPRNSISSVSHTYGISTEAHVWHIAQEQTNLMNSRTSTITHFVEHSTRLHDCKMLHFEFTNWLLNFFFFFFFTHINYHLFSCRWLNDNELKTLPSGIFSDLSSLRYL